MGWQHVFGALALVVLGYWLGGKWPGMLGKVPVIGGALNS